MPAASRKPKNFLFWAVFAGFALVSAGALFFSKPLFLERAGIKARLLGKAARLKGEKPERISSGIGRMLKAYLDASKHTSRAEVAVFASSAQRLGFRIVLPWAEVSAKKRRQRAGLVCRLAVDMLRAAGGGDVAVVVEVRRRRRKSPGSDPVGSYSYLPGAGGFVWREPG